jgi:hypothetical protein
MKTIREDSRFTNLASEEAPIRVVIRKQLQKFNNNN